MYALKIKLLSKIFESNSFGLFENQMIYILKGRRFRISRLRSARKRHTTA